MTMNDAESGRRLRCALFLDFDNVYVGLQRLDPSAAEAFASAPTRWLTALKTGDDEEGEFSRRFLIRACYLNPSVFSHFRPNFTRAGFSVVDCPSLTQQGKSSADINLVLDAVDALSAQTRYDEFVILSADADFTPLALRCRAADRRVTIITAGPAASAYRAVADTVITADELAELVKEPEATALEEPPAPTAEPERASSRSSPSTAPAKAGPSSNSAAHGAVLRLVRSADRPLTGGAVLVVETFLGRPGHQVQAAFSDLNALPPGGLERSEQEYAALIDTAGLHLTDLIHTSTPMSILEAKAQQPA